MAAAAQAEMAADSARNAIVAVPAAAQRSVTEAAEQESRALKTAVRRRVDGAVASAKAAPVALAEEVGGATNVAWEKVATAASGVPGRISDAAQYRARQVAQETGFVVQEVAAVPGQVGARAGQAVGRVGEAAGEVAANVAEAPQRLAISTEKKVQDVQKEAKRLLDETLDDIQQAPVRARSEVSARVEEVRQRVAEAVMQARRSLGQ